MVWVALPLDQPRSELRYDAIIDNLFYHISLILVIKLTLNVLNFFFF